MRVRVHARNVPVILDELPRPTTRRLPPLYGLMLALGVSVLAWTAIAWSIRAVLN